MATSAHQLKLDVCLGKAVEWARAGGDMIAKAWSGDVAIEFKSTIDLVTQVDKAVEALIVEAIQREFPEHSILGEESASEAGTYTLGPEPTWCIDPIDGTTNFIHRFPFACVSIALVVDRQPVLGVVFNPILNELYSAVRGGGARLNDAPIHVSQTAELSHAVISTNVGYVRDDAGVAFILGNMRAILEKNVRSMRSLGSSALEVCQVACGRFDAFYEFGIHPWDIAAAVCILREAGGVAVDPSGADLDLLSRRILAATPAVASLLPAYLDSKPPFLPSRSS